MMEALKQAQLFDENISSLKLLVSKVAGARDNVAGSADEQNRQARMLEARIELLKDELDSLRREQ